MVLASLFLQPRRLTTIIIVPERLTPEPEMSNHDRNMLPLLEELKSLETELHKNETRRNQQRMERLLHPDFVEFGRSGMRYTRAEILTEFGKGNALPIIQTRNFEGIVLGDGVVLLTYVSAHVDDRGNTHRQTWRSSIWVRTEVGWQIRFHQGTPVHSSEG